MNTLAQTCTWVIRDSIDETPDTKTLVLEAKGQRPTFIAGQYLTVLLPDTIPSEGKSYSISSTPTDEKLTLTIKRMGSFSNTILEQHIGDTLVTSLPYGFFYPEPEDQNDLIFLAGGVGITPCISIIESLLKSDYPKAITLLYSNKTLADIIFKERIDTLTQTHKNFRVIYFITREPGTNPDTVYSRINASHFRESAYGEADFFVCGSINFTKSLWKELRDTNIPSTRIYTEGFF